MAVKFFMVVLSVVAAVKAGGIVQAVDEYDPHPQYSYGYDVQDSLTGDYKSQQESRDGDVVQGSYSLVESDGTRRIVEYTADPLNGFNAIVRKEPLAVATKAVVTPVVAKAYAPLAYSAQAPILTKSYSPLAYSSPLAYHSPAPVASLAYNNPILAKPYYNQYSSPIVANAPLAYNNFYAH